MPDTLTPGDGQDLLARIKQARERRDPDAMLELYRDDAEHRTDPFAPSLRGANAIRRYWNDVAAELVRVDFDAERVWVSGATVLVSWHGAYTRASTGERVRERCFSTIELDDAGLIERVNDWPATRVVGVDSGVTEADLAPAEGGHERG